MSNPAIYLGDKSEQIIANLIETTLIAMGASFKTSENDDNRPVYLENFFIAAFTETQPGSLVTAEDIAQAFAEKINKAAELAGLDVRAVATPSDVDNAVQIMGDDIDSAGFMKLLNEQLQKELSKLLDHQLAKEAIRSKGA